ncbi:hypothetical protein GCM10010052_05870 [Paenarthrobacter histidinolovorans]|nr:hypothetical protein GCM10010052_05870 [Paenarthrobacter histidinolovorans]
MVQTAGLHVPVDTQLVDLDRSLNGTFVDGGDAHTSEGIGKQLMDAANGKDGSGVHGHQSTDGRAGG